jgi:hypothetical protein
MWNKNMKFKSLTKVAATVSATFALLLPCQSFAELWRLTPGITLEERYEDNIRLTTAPHDSVTGTLLKGNLKFSRLTENSGITGQLYMHLSDYTGDEEVKNNNSNLHLSLASNYRTELTRWDLNGFLIQDTTLRSIDFSDDSEDSPTDVDEGLVKIDIKRYRLQLTPSWDYSLSERTNLRMSYKYSDVRYEDNPAGSGLFDYYEHGVNAGFFRRLTERDTINANVGISRFESPDNADNKVDGYNLTVGYKRLFTETTSGGINVGVSHSTQKSNVLNSDVDGYVLRFRMDHKTETTRYKEVLSHDLQPSGTGSIVEANRFRFDIKHRFSERLNGLLVMQYTSKDSLDSSSAKNIEYYTFKPRLSWKLTRWWTLSGGYEYRNSKRGSNDVAADNNAVYISLAHNKQITFD